MSSEGKMDLGDALEDTPQVMGTGAHLLWSNCYDFYAGEGLEWCVVY